MYVFDFPSGFYILFCCTLLILCHHHDNAPHNIILHLFLVCHAEVNAVLNKNSSDVKDCSIYVALFPCNECAKIIVQSGIKEVVYYSDKYHERPEVIASKRMFDVASVVYR